MLETCGSATVTSQPFLLDHNISVPSLHTAMEACTSHNRTCLLMSWHMYKPAARRLLMSAYQALGCMTEVLVPLL